MLKKKLQEIYLAPLKPQAEVYIGVELEFPIVNMSGEATDITVSKALLAYLVSDCGLVVESRDSDQNPVQVYHPETEDRILFEVSYNILEFAFAKVVKIQEVDSRFQHYLAVIQHFLRQRGHELQGIGVHPAWDKNDNTPVQQARYQMLMAYLSLAIDLPDHQCHPFVTYGAFICGNQVQLDVTKENYLRVLNAFNKIESAKAYLFANSPFNGANWETNLSRDRFWEESMHGVISENVGIFPHDFSSEEEFLDYLAQTAMFTAQRDGQTLYFRPKRLKDYLQHQAMTAYQSPRELKPFTPQLDDLATHRAYHYQCLTRRGTVEFRSVCTQPLHQTFAPTAFHLGLLENIAELEAYLAQAPFFQIYGNDYRALRRQFSKSDLTFFEKKDIRKFSEDLLNLARKGLEKRGLSEEIYLPLIK